MYTLPSPPQSDLEQKLAEKVRLCSEEVEAAQNRLEQAKQHYQNVLDARSFALGNIADVHAMPDQEKRKRLQREDYYTHVIPYLEKQGSSHFRNIYIHLKGMFDDITEAQVNKFLNKDTLRDDSRLERDTSIPRGGFFKLRTKEGASSVEGDLLATGSIPVAPAF